jgi:hypothetical protein
MATNTNNGPLSALLASIPEVERPRWEQFADAIIAEAREQLDETVGQNVSDAIEDVIERAVEKGLEDAMDDLDLEQEAEDAVKEAVEDYDFDDQIEDAIEKAMREFDIGDSVNNAIEEAGLDEIEERCSDVLDAAIAATEQAEILAKRMADISSGGVLRRLRWLLTGR